MPYTIALLKASSISAETVRTRLLEALEHSRFSARLEIVDVGGKLYGRGIVVKPVRLREAKPYCGQHPGECQVVLGFERPKRRGRWLEWEDWVDFNNLVNAVLDKMKVKTADVWSVPQEALDTGKKMWIRRHGLGGRRRYDWDPQPSSFGRELRIWNHGTDDQFE
jgi:hypothetical protein